MGKLTGVLSVVRKNQQSSPVAWRWITCRSREKILVERIGHDSRHHEIAGVKARYDFCICALRGATAQTLSHITVSIVVRFDWHTSQANCRAAGWADLAGVWIDLPGWLCNRGIFARPVVFVFDGRKERGAHTLAAALPGDNFFLHAIADCLRCE